MYLHSLINKAVKGDFEARKTLYVWAYLWPRLEQEFAPAAEDITGGTLRPNLMTAGNYELTSILALVSLGPQPEPPDSPTDTKVAISAMKDFHERLVALADQIAAEISALEAGKGGGVGSLRV